MEAKRFSLTEPRRFSLTAEQVGAMEMAVMQQVAMEVQVAFLMAALVVHHQQHLMDLAAAVPQVTMVQGQMDPRPPHLREMEALVTQTRHHILVETGVQL